MAIRVACLGTTGDGEGAAERAVLVERARRAADRSGVRVALRAAVVAGLAGFGWLLGATTAAATPDQPETIAFDFWVAEVDDLLPATVHDVLDHPFVAADSSNEAVADEAAPMVAAGDESGLVLVTSTPLAAESEPDAESAEAVEDESVDGESFEPVEPQSVEPESVEAEAVEAETVDAGSSDAAEGQPAAAGPAGSEPALPDRQPAAATPAPVVATAASASNVTTPITRPSSRSAPRTPPPAARVPTPATPVPAGTPVTTDVDDQPGTPLLPMPGKPSPAAAPSGAAGTTSGGSANAPAPVAVAATAGGWRPDAVRYVRHVTETWLATRWRAQDPSTSPD